jgi:hypothetical protein
MPSSEFSRPFLDDQGVDVADRAPAMATLASLTEAARVRPSAVMTL